MDKKTLIIIEITIAVLVIAGIAWLSWFYFKTDTSNALKNAENAAEAITDSATKGVLPSLETNPMADKPDINPAGSANPIKNVKTNPFK